MATFFKPFQSVLIVLALMAASCSQSSRESSQTVSTGVQPGPGQSAVVDPDSKPNVVQVAIGSPDHSTLVKAVQAANLVDDLSNVGPFTVFAPVNSAFDALPSGVLQSLLKPENKESLIDILEYHVYVGVIRESMIRDGQVLNQVNGKNVRLGKSGDALTVNDANIIGTVEASNGIVYVIDKVLNYE
ncbi:MAG: fasciclin domain-containing protein [Cyclobacteriaceae bacterium]|nr:fasciclin domain-containing protein [Cyclobacteriaceae bacterium]